VPGEDWEGDVSVFAYVIEGFASRTQTEQLDARRLIGGILSDTIDALGIAVEHQSWTSFGYVLISGDHLQPLRLLEKCAFQLMRSNETRGAPLRLRYALHHGEIHLQGEGEACQATGHVLDICAQILSAARADQVIATGRYRSKALAFGTIAMGLFTRFEDIVDDNGAIHEVWNVHQDPGFGIAARPQRGPAPTATTDAADRETALRHTIEELLPALERSVAKARLRKDSAFQLFDRFEGCLRLLRATLAIESEQRIERIARLHRHLERDIKGIYEIGVQDCFEAVPVTRVTDALERLTPVDKRVDADQSSIPNDLLQDEALPHWDQRRTLLSEIAEIERMLDQSAEFLTQSERQIIRMELDELRIVLDLDPMPLEELSEARERLEWLRLDLLRRLQSATQLFMGIFALELPARAVFQDIEWGPELVVIPAGDFAMGSPEGEEGRYGDEGPRHEVTLARRFALGRYPVTFDEYDRFTDATGRTEVEDEGWGRGRRPVINVTWRDAEAYVTWLSRETGKPYRLPSEAEWEYACRAGTTTRYSWGDDIKPENANYHRNVDKTTEVGNYTANPWELYDMHGNVLEWCGDHWYETYEGAPDDGRVWMQGGSDRRVLRGGSWIDAPRVLRSAFRSGNLADDRISGSGFRVARTLR